MITKCKRMKIANVISDKCDKTRTVSITYNVKNGLYKKMVTKKSKIMIHDPENKSKVGDKVEIIESKPFSTNKRFRLVCIINK